MNRQNKLRSRLVVGICLLSTLIAGPALADKNDAKPFDLRRGFADIAEQVTPAVVFIEVESTVKLGGTELRFNNPFEGLDSDLLDRLFGGRLRVPQQREFRRSGAGSGFIISEDGYILTNNHVVNGADKIRVKLRDGTSYDAELIGTDEQTEVAVIRIQGKGLPVLPLGDAEKLRVGDWVIAIGNPYGLSETLTVGVVSAKGRSGMRITDYEDFIQTDAAINPGNSGGPLLNVDGEVVGINTAIFSRSGGSMGIGFAVPINMAVAIKDQLIAEGRVDRGYLGVMLNPQEVDDDMAQSFGLPKRGGALIAEVQPESPAARAGLKDGDVITTVDGKPVNGNAMLRNTIAMVKPGTKVNLQLYRDGKAVNKTVEVGRLADAAGLAAAAGSSVKKAADLSLNETLLRKWGFALAPLSRDEAQALGLNEQTGLRVTQIRENSPAARRGLEVDSVVLSVNRREVESLTALGKVLGGDDIDGILLRVRLPAGHVVYMVLRAEE